MLRYILWRIAAMVPTLVLISMLVLTIIELPPGDYFESYVSELRAQGEAVDMQEIEELRVQYGFDKPPVLRYFHWVAGMLQGDFGYSFEYQLPVSDVVGDRLWLTVMVSFFTIIFTWLIAFPIGIYSATHQYSWADYGLTLIGLLGIVPDRTIVLDVPEAVAAERMRRRGGDTDRYERLDAAFHARVRQGFREIAAANPKRCVLLDASGAIQAVHTAVMTTVWT